MNPKAIIEGIGNTIFKKEETEKLATERLAICQQCKHYTGKTCSYCGCYTAFKIRQNTEKCPVGKW